MALQHQVVDSTTAQRGAHGQACLATTDNDHRVMRTVQNHVNPSPAARPGGSRTTTRAVVIDMTEVKLAGITRRLLPERFQVPQFALRGRLRTKVGIARLQMHPRARKPTSTAF
jgi:hypothetical protein